MSRYNISNVRAAFVDTKTGALTKFGIDVLQKISDVLGLPSGDFVSDLDTAELFPWQISDSEPEYGYNFNRSNAGDEISKFVGFNRGQKEVKPYFIASSNHTCYGPEIVEATSNITITLNQEPNESEVTTIKRNTTAGNVILDGGSFNIDGSSTYTMVVNYEGINVVFNGTEYLII